MNKFIRYKNHIILYSEDDWKSINELKQEAKDAEEEKNQDIASTVKLRYLLGENRAKIIIEELMKIRETFNFQKDDGFGLSFEVFAIAVLYNIDYDVAKNNYIVCGNQDGKIDAIYWKGEDKNILYQIKIDTLDPKELNIAKVMKENYLSYIKQGKIFNADTKDLLDFCDRHKEHLTRSKDMDIKIISNNDIEKMNITPLEIFNRYFYNILIRKDSNMELSLTIPLDHRVANIGNRDDIYAYFVDAKTFIQDLLNCENINVKENLYKFFHDNVRGDLGSNDNIQQTIDCDPKSFVKYNNGVTITGKVKYMNGSEGIKIVNPVINNGQQTIWNIVRNYPNISDVSLLIIVKDEENDNVKSKISRFTNSQRNIKPADLLSLNENLRSLQEQIFNLTIETDPIFLEINSSGSRNYNKILRKMYLPSRIISLTDFCKLYFSVDDLELGNWKSSISTQLRKIIDRDISYSIEKALEVCNIISNTKEYIGNIDDDGKRNDLKSADLAFMYVQYQYKITLDQAATVIGHINDLYYYSIPDDQRISKVIDLYKSNTIVEKIKNAVKSLGLDSKKLNSEQIKNEKKIELTHTLN